VVWGGGVGGEFHEGREEGGGAHAEPGGEIEGGGGEHEGDGEVDCGWVDGVAGFLLVVVECLKRGREVDCFERGIYLLLPNWPKPTTLRSPGILTEAAGPIKILFLVPSSLNNKQRDSRANQDQNTKDSFHKNKIIIQICNL
jgi:hypothetical protein